MQNLTNIRCEAERLLSDINSEIGRHKSFNKLEDEYRLARGKLLGLESKLNRMYEENGHAQLYRHERYIYNDIWDAKSAVEAAKATLDNFILDKNARLKFDNQIKDCINKFDKDETILTLQTNYNNLQSSFYVEQMESIQFHKIQLSEKCKLFENTSEMRNQMIEKIHGINKILDSHSESKILKIITFTLYKSQIYKEYIRDREVYKKRVIEYDNIITPCKHSISQLEAKITNIECNIVTFYGETFNAEYSTLKKKAEKYNEEESVLITSDCSYKDLISLLSKKLENSKQIMSYNEIKYKKFCLNLTMCNEFNTIVNKAKEYVEDELRNFKRESKIQEEYHLATTFNLNIIINKDKDKKKEVMDNIRDFLTPPTYNSSDEK